MKLMATDVARLIRAHVKDGGWLGAGWPSYVLPKGARVTQYQLTAGYDLAMTERGLFSQAEDNFAAEWAAAQREDPE